MSRYSCVVMAGGKGSEEFQAATGALNSAALRVNGTPLVDIVCRALRDSDCVDDLVVMGAAAANERSEPDHGTILDNVYAGAAIVARNPYVLFATGDMPFITAAAVRRFCDLAGEANTDLVYPIVPLELCQQAYPGMKRTGLRLREGAFTGGNLLIVKRSTLEQNAQFIRETFAARKSVWKLARLFGFRTLMSLALSRIRPEALTLAQLEQAVGRFINGTVKAVIVEYPELGVDIDRLDHVEALKRHGVQFG